MFSLILSHDSRTRKWASTRPTPRGKGVTHRKGRPFPPYFASYDSVVFQTPEGSAQNPVGQTRSHPRWADHPGSFIYGRSEWLSDSTSWELSNDMTYEIGRHLQGHIGDHFLSHSERPISLELDRHVAADLGQSHSVWTAHR